MWIMWAILHSVLHAGIYRPSAMPCLLCHRAPAWSINMLRKNTRCGHDTFFYSESDISQFLHEFAMRNYTNPVDTETKVLLQSFFFYFLTASQRSLYERIRSFIGPNTNYNRITHCSVDYNGGDEWQSIMLQVSSCQFHIPRRIKRQLSQCSWMVGWLVNVPFQHKYGYNYQKRLRYTA